MSDCANIEELVLGEPGKRTAEESARLAAHVAACGDCARLQRGLVLADAGLRSLSAAPLPALPPFSGLQHLAARAGRSRRRRARLRTMLPLALLACSSALAATLIVGFVRVHRRALRTGDVFEAAHGSRAAVLPGGESIVLEAGRLSVAAEGSEDLLRLDSGAVTVRVPPLPAGKSLAVQTPDGEVRAHGTRFRVERSTAGTRVVLSEGVVSIDPSGHGRARVVLHPGESAFVEPLRLYRDRLRSVALAALGRGESAAAEEALRSLLATEPDGVLAGEAHAWLAWLRQERGKDGDALREYTTALSLAGARDELWADNAAAGIALLRERIDPATAASDWRAYLDRFPGGVHRSLARMHLAHLQAR